MSVGTTARRHPVPRTSLRRHVRRAAGRDPNPLCRPVDRARSRALVVLALAVTAAISVAVGAGLLVLRGQTHAAQQVARHRHAVTAVTTGPAQPDDLRAGGTQAHAQARWSYPTGPGGGRIPVPEGTVPGTDVPIHVDDAGNPASPPRTTEQIASDAVLVVLGTATALVLGAEGGFALRRHVLGRRAEAGWEAAWGRVEPEWSGRR
ncbi:Rv1733c family protein [Kitasatospora sp. NPDC004240]